MTSFELLSKPLHIFSYISLCRCSPAHSGSRVSFTSNSVSRPLMRLPQSYYLDEFKNVNIWAALSWLKVDHAQCMFNQQTPNSAMAIFRIHPYTNDDGRSLPLHSLRRLKYAGVRACLLVSRTGLLGDGMDEVPSHSVFLGYHLDHCFDWWPQS